jgi:hypothetical protein
MVKGVIEFVRPEKCTKKKLVRQMPAIQMQTSGTEETGLLEGYAEGSV